MICFKSKRVPLSKRKGSQKRKVRCWLCLPLFSLFFSLLALLGGSQKRSLQVCTLYLKQYGVHCKGVVSSMSQLQQGCPYQGAISRLVKQRVETSMSMQRGILQAVSINGSRSQIMCGQDRQGLNLAMINVYGRELVSMQLNIQWQGVERWPSHLGPIVMACSDSSRSPCR